MIDNDGRTDPLRDILSGEGDRAGDIDLSDRTVARDGVNARAKVGGVSAPWRRARRVGADVPIRAVAEVATSGGRPFTLKPLVLCQSTTADPDQIQPSCASGLSAIGN